MNTTSLETLLKLAEASKAQRLAPADEEHAAALLRELLGGGKAGISAAVEPLIALPWIVGVNAVGAAWPDLSLPMRRHLLSSLAKIDSEPARRVRLSLARAIFKLDPPTGLKLAAAVAGDLKEAETGALPPRHRHIFHNVFIGKGKPWLMQLPLADLKGAEADALVHCGVECFSLCPPISQLSILRWVYAGGRFKKLPKPDLDTALKAIARWNAKLQRQLIAAIPDLPEAMTAVLKPEALQPAPAPEPEPAAQNQAQSRGKQGRTPEKARPQEKAKRVPGSEPGQKEIAKPEGQENAPTEPDALPAQAPIPEKVPAVQPPKVIETITIPRRERPRSEEPRPAQATRPEQRPREERRSREDQRHERDERREEKARPFDFRENLRGLEAYVNGLRTELEQAKAQLRRREEDFKRGGRGGRSQDVAEGKPSVDQEALLRHNAQLETSLEELRSQLEDLKGHHETLAESRLLHTEHPLPEGTAEQLQSYLSLKLQESYETYLAMRKEPLDKVFRFDYRDLLGSVFDVLRDQGVHLKPGSGEK